MQNVQMFQNYLFVYIFFYNFLVKASIAKLMFSQQSYQPQIRKWLHCFKEYHGRIVYKFVVKSYHK